MLSLKHISGILGQFTIFLQKKLVLLVILLPLECYVLSFTFVSTYVFNTESLNQEIFQKIGAN